MGTHPSPVGSGRDTSGDATGWLKVNDIDTLERLASVTGSARKPSPGRTSFPHQTSVGHEQHREPVTNPHRRLPGTRRRDGARR